MKAYKSEKDSIYKYEYDLNGFKIYTKENIDYLLKSFFEKNIEMFKLSNSDVLYFPVSINNEDYYFSIYKEHNGNYNYSRITKKENIKYSTNSYVFTFIKIE